VVLTMERRGPGRPPTYEPTPGPHADSWPVGCDVTGFDMMGCPQCSGTLTLAAPFRASPWRWRMLLVCEENQRHRWLLNMELLEARGG